MKIITCGSIYISNYVFLYVVISPYCFQQSHWDIKKLKIDLQRKESQKTIYKMTRITIQKFPVGSKS